MQESDPVLLAGMQRATVVIVALQLVVFCMFGVANDYVLHRAAYQACFAVLAAVVAWQLWRVWKTDILNDRITMLRTAARLNLVALLMVGGFAALKANYVSDAFLTGSRFLHERVMDQSWMALAFAGACALVLLHVTRLWASCPPPADASDAVNPVSIAHVMALQKWNIAGAVLGMFGPPVTLPCLAACVLAGSTLSHPMATGDEPPPVEIFYRVKGKQDRFDTDY